MDKKNDIQVNKISKWEAAPKNMGTLFTYIELVIGMACSLSPEIRDNLYDLLDKTLDEYNKLEAKHQLDCGLISDYAEENARLKQKNEKASNNIRDLRRVLEENDIATYLNPVTVSWGVANIALQKKTEHFNTQLDNLREKLHNMSDICSRDEDDSEMLQAILRKDGYTIEYDGDIDDETIRCQDSFDLCKETTQDEVIYQYGRWTLRRPLNFSEAKANADAAILRNQCDRHIDLLDKLRWALEDKGISCEWSEAALKWNLYDKTNTTCKSCKQHYEEELRIREKEKDEKDKLIDELNQTARHECEELHEKIDRLWRVNDELNRKIKDLESKNESLNFKYCTYKTIGYGRRIIPLKEKIQTLEKRNKDLKDLLDKNESFGKYVGERVADFIREGCDKGVYKLHPLTRIDIHVEEIKDVPITFARYAIPRISVIFNNTQTEMERDTAEHECEELEKKFKELVKENEDLRTTLKMCERDANMSRSLCHNIAFNAERARNKTPWFNDEPCNICTTKYALRGDDI